MRLFMLVLIGSLFGSPALAANLRFTIVSAKLDAAKVGKHDHPTSNAHLSDLACLSLPGLRAIPGLCRSGGEPTGDVKGGAPVDAFVRVELGDHVVRTYPIPGSLTPKWEYGVVLDRAFLDANEYANFVIYDYDGPGAERKLGDKLVKTKELSKPGTRTLKGVGGGTEITYRVEVLPDSAPARNYAFRVPADQQMADLARNAKTEGPGYVVVPVAEGEVVEVTATGQIQPNAKKHPERVAGPNGIPTIQTKIQFNQPGFRGCPGCDHAALIGQIGSTGMVIGAKKKFAVEHAGLLVLAINDLKTQDNAGGFDVKVTVSL
ncbi:MAG TPA: C2 domain-containing protein, partial [Gemmatimonadales bacterium]|nr:C2 domain-containing protein [Gemmatimonadales bacterium]